MAWRFTWLRSWDEIWDPVHLTRWRRAIVGGPDVHATPFMHPDVIAAWLSATGGEGAYAPFFLHARHDAGQQVLWLLVRRRAGWSTFLQRALIPAGGDLFDYHDPVVTPVRTPGEVLVPGFWLAFAAELRRHEGVWFDTCALSRIRPECRSGSLDFPVPAGIAPFVRLDRYTDFESYMASRRKSIREQRRKWERVAAEQGLSFRQHGAGDTEAVLNWLPKFEAARAARYPGSGLPEGYLRALASAGLDAGLVAASTLVLAERPISWDFSFLMNGVFYNYLGTFDEEFRRLSPGQLHTCRIIEWLFGEQARVFDSLLGLEGYKNDWTDGEAMAQRSGAIRSRAVATRVRRLAWRGLRRIEQWGPGAAADQRTRYAGAPVGT